MILYKYKTDNFFLYLYVYVTRILLRVILKDIRSAKMYKRNIRFVTIIDTFKRFFLNIMNLLNFRMKSTKRLTNRNKQINDSITNILIGTTKHCLRIKIINCSQVDLYKIIN